MLIYSKKYYKLIFIITLMYYLCLIVPEGFWIHYLTFEFYDLWLLNTMISFISTYFLYLSCGKYHKVQIRTEDQIWAVKNRTMVTIILISFLFNAYVYNWDHVVYIIEMSKFPFFLVKMAIYAICKIVGKVVESRHKFKSEKENHIQFTTVVNHR